MVNNHVKRCSASLGRKKVSTETTARCLPGLAKIKNLIMFSAEDGVGKWPPTDTEGEGINWPDLLKSSVAVPIKI